MQLFTPNQDALNQLNNGYPVMFRSHINWKDVVGADGGGGLKIVSRHVLKSPLKNPIQTNINFNPIRTRSKTHKNSIVSFKSRIIKQVHVSYSDDEDEGEGESM